MVEVLAASAQPAPAGQVKTDALSLIERTTLANIAKESIVYEYDLGRAPHGVLLLERSVCAVQRRAAMPSALAAAKKASCSTGWRCGICVAVGGQFSARQGTAWSAGAGS